MKLMEHGKWNGLVATPIVERASARVRQVGVFTIYSNALSVLVQKLTAEAFGIF
jgi:hypothetical protein